jgi:hypothetical protein
MEILKLIPIKTFCALALRVLGEASPIKVFQWIEDTFPQREAGV